MIKTRLLTLLFTLVFTWVNGQVELARKYVEEGEYEKAEAILADEYKLGPTPDVYALRLTNFVNAQKYYKALSLVDSQREVTPSRSPYLLVDKIWVAVQMESVEEEEDCFEELDPFLVKNPGLSYQLGQSLTNYGLFDQALRVFTRAEALAPNMTFHYQKALVYAEMGDIEAMFDEYLKMVEVSPSYLNSIKTTLSRSVSKDPNNDINRIVRTSLLQKMRESENPVYTELLIWLYLQESNYSMAFIQYKALEKRGFAMDREMYDMGVAAFQNEEYAMAQQTFEYLIKKGPDHPYYYDARGIVLEVEEVQLKESFADLAQWQVLLDKIQSMLDQPDFEVIYVTLRRQKARILTGPFKKPKEAYAELEIALEESIGRKREYAETQMQMAETLMAMGDYVEALLMYARVEKAFETNPIGQQAKYNKAMISYYQGDFEWAKAQFNGLKASPDKLIANDAMNMWLLISSNLDLDTTVIPMKRFAHADLLIFQGEDEKAFAVLDSLQSLPIADPLLDEILYRKSEIKRRAQSYDEAIALLEQLRNLPRRSFFKDDAVYWLGRLYEEQKGDVQLAMDAYQEVFSRYPNSIFSKEARERFRSLRGDQL
ncbi:MAG: tetratricopeptide repeat protein [Schleiferiaceae bacterium]